MLDNPYISAAYGAAYGGLVAMWVISGDRIEHLFGAPAFSDQRKIFVISYLMS
jgi:hypothetical protein